MPPHSTKLSRTLQNLDFLLSLWCCPSTKSSKYIDKYNFDVLKYIKNFFNISTTMYFEGSADRQ